jgi:TonB family protein
MTCPSCRAENQAGATACSECGSLLASRLSIEPGSLIASRWEVLSLLGAGGMGRVFKARDRSLDEIVAVKIIGRETLDPAAASRFRSEVRLAWRVRHRNVCGIHEYGEDGSLLFITMEYVEGLNLRQLLREQGPFIWEDACDIGIQAAEGLDAIHEAGVIHRDLKASNIMRDRRGVVRLMDFGIAKTWSDSGDSGITRAGQVVGSPEYMSPEQIRGGPVDFRSDLYSLGIVVYELFTGRVPFRASTPVATLLLHLEAAPPLSGSDAARIPRALVPLLQKALAKHPADRFLNSQEMRAALQQARAELGRQRTDTFVRALTGRRAAGVDSRVVRRQDVSAPSTPVTPTPGNSTTLQVDVGRPHLRPSEGSSTSRRRAIGLALLGFVLVGGVTVTLPRRPDPAGVTIRSQSAPIAATSPESQASPRPVPSTPTPTPSSGSNTSRASSQNRSQRGPSTTPPSTTAPPPPTTTMPPPTTTLQPPLTTLALTPSPSPSPSSSPERGTARRPEPVLVRAKCANCPEPRFPELAERLGIEGTVRLEASVDEKGRVVAVTVISAPDPLLARSAEDAVRRWKYDPATRDGVPTIDVVVVSLEFRRVRTR